MNEAGSQQALENQIPELPNFINLIYEKYHTQPWADFLHYWENILFSFLIALFISLIFYIGTRKRAMIPSGLQNFLEWIIESIETLILGILGTSGIKYIPFLGTLFIYILSMNWMGMIPLLKSPTSNISITAAFAVIVFIYVQFLNMRHMGFLGFLFHLAGSPKNGLGWIMAPLMFTMEVITQLARPITLALRLCGNLLGEHILLGAFALLGIAMLYGFPIQLPFNFLALLTSLMQALVFTVLSTVYILLSNPHEEH